MKKVLLLTVSVFFIQLAFGQDQAIRIINQSSYKEVIFKENKRIKLKTKNGQKISGKFRIEDGQTISVKSRPILLSEIAEIKRDPLVGSAVISSAFIYLGAVTIGIGAIAGVFADSTAFLAMIPGAGLIYTGAKSPNFFKKYKNDGSWSYEVMNAP